MRLTCIVYLLLSVGSGVKYKEKFIWSNKNFKRPEWTGEILASTQNGLVKQISGVLLPVATNAKRCPKRSFVIPLPFDVKTFTSEMDKGHIFALELGGPNVRWNIVMQPSNWQRFGHWRNFEKKLLQLALKVYKLENSVCADEVHMMRKPKQVVRIQYKLNYNSKRQLRNVSGRLYIGDKMLSFQIKTKGKVLFNKLKLFQIEQKCLP